MRTLNFTKLVASGNDFCLIEARSIAKVINLAALARGVCSRKYGAGADGLLVVSGSEAADMRMRIFNADGSEAEMCGNGARCAALWLASRRKRKSCEVRIETRAGIISSRVLSGEVRIMLTAPKNIRFDIPLRLKGRLIKANYINTGVPHAVIFVEGLAGIDVTGLGRLIRYDKNFSPAGTNVDFVEILNERQISVRTYERGVEDETLACGTGAVASALMSNARFGLGNTGRIDVITRGGETLRVYFEKAGSGFKNAWLQGRAKIVYKGEIYV